MQTIHAAAEEDPPGPALAGRFARRVPGADRPLEPRVRAWVLVDRDGAPETAKRRHDEVRRGQWRGPLHGIPLGIKDIIDVFDWPTAAGSRLWANSIARQDATVVQRLREAGAVLVGKTVTTQYASFDPPATRNPWNLERTPGGSQQRLGGGGGVRHVPGRARLADRRLDHAAGVVLRRGGMKPTYGRVSVEGVVPLAPSMDHVGPMARCVRDLAILFEAMADDSKGAERRNAPIRTAPIPGTSRRPVHGPVFRGHARAL